MSPFRIAPVLLALALVACGNANDDDSGLQLRLEGARSCGLHCSTMAFETKTIEHLARYLVSGSNGFGACELVQLSTGIAGSHAWVVWMITSIIVGRLDRRAEWLFGQAQNAARQAHVHGSGHYHSRGNTEERRGGERG